VGDAPVRLVQGDARSLPWPEESFDLVTCSLAIHHFSTEEAPCVLSEMWRVTRGSALVVDLTRSYPAYAGVWLATRIVARNRMTRHDGPLSVLRAYTKDELHRLAVGAGWKNLSLQRHAFFRQTLLGRKSVPHVR
jgi:ubiquinone/menaquinone biosynthesis C-methylase UbiE